MRWASFLALLGHMKTWVDRWTLAPLHTRQHPSYEYLPLLHPPRTSVGNAWNLRYYLLYLQLIFTYNDLLSSLWSILFLIAPACFSLGFTLLNFSASLGDSSSLTRLSLHSQVVSWSRSLNFEDDDASPCDIQSGCRKYHVTLLSLGDLMLFISCVLIVSEYKICYWLWKLMVLLQQGSLFPLCCLSLFGNLLWNVRNPGRFFFLFLCDRLDWILALQAFKKYWI